jgi:hypothetical protein
MVTKPDRDERDEEETTKSRNIAGQPVAKGALDAAPLPGGRTAVDRERTDLAPIEIWAERKGLTAPAEYWKFAAAKAFRGWTAGLMITEAEFDEAIAAQGKKAIR